MKIYTVHNRQEASGSLVGLAEDVILVKEGFSWPALFIPLIWLIYKRMWIVLGFYLAAEAGLMATVYGGLLPEIGATAGTLALSLILGFEGNDLYRWTLHRRRYREHGFSVGEDYAAAEHRYFSAMADALGRGRAAAPVQTGRV